MQVNPFVVVALLLICSLIASKLSDRLGIPALLMFLGIGMLAGSDGPGSIYFDNAKLTNWLGTIALAFILFSGGFNTQWRAIKPIVKRGVVLATAGVILTALFVAVFSHYAFNIPFKEATLLGAIISSTDAAAVFSILRAKGIGLKGNLSPMLEFESGSNDPMAIFLTISALQVVMHPEEASVTTLLVKFVVQMLVGVAFGAGLGKFGVYILKRIRLDYEGLYPVLGISLVLLTYGITDMLWGNGFLAVYICGIYLGNSDYLFKRHIARFNDGLAWLMQITMFLILGLLVFPSQLPGVAWEGLLIAAFLMIVARPLAVYICMIKSKFTFKEQTLVGWAGLRGAVPIILATFPLMQNYKHASLLFNLVFFIALASVLIQGKTLMLVAKLLNLDQVIDRPPEAPIEFNPESGTVNETREVDIRVNSVAVGKRISELSLPDDVRILLVRRQRNFITPRGNTKIKPDDVLILYGEPEELHEARNLLISGATA